MTDDAGYNDWGFMADLNGKATDVLTPNLDNLAANAAIMREGYVCAGFCSPARAGFLTGQYGQRFGYEDNPSNQPGNTQGLEANQQLISHYLGDLGYTTGAIGKWHLGEVDGVNRPLDLGVDEFYGFFGGGRPFWPGYGDSQRALRRGDVSIESQWGSQGDPSRYDPVNGRYLTDAFGEEAADFINRHAGDEEPFFLYVALNAPHSPLQAKQSDLNMFPDIVDPERKLIAAMTYGVDRAVGDITSALAVNGIDGETVVIFMNDNGGADTAPHDNYPLRGSKGTMWEGGIRVPMFIKAPGIAAGVYDEPVVSMDLVPTLVNMAGGDASQLDTNGVDIRPYLEGETAGSPHEVMFWRHLDGRFAVRKGDWKLTRPGNATFARLHNLVMDPDEGTYYNAAYPEVLTELRRDLTNWEVTLEKAKWGPLGDTSVVNLFDHFVFGGTTENWNTTNAWRRAGTSTEVTLRQWDSYPNAILEFGVQNSASYTVTNNMVRATQLTFMLNELRFTGNYSGTGERSGTINGNALLMVDSLEGLPARIRNEATSSSPSTFGFNLNIELQLYNDLVFDGNGTQPLVVNGTIRDYYESRGVTKTGSSEVVLAGSNHFTRALVVQEGRLSTNNLDGDLQIVGGSFGAMGITNIGGDYFQTGGALAIELGPSSDQLVVIGSADVSGILDLSLADGFLPSIGQIFSVLSANQLSGTFEQIVFPTLAAGAWSIAYTSDSVFLHVTLPGDFNRNGNVDAADYVVWRRMAGQSVAIGTGADGNYDGIVNELDFDLWKSNFGIGNSAGIGTSTGAVPEPATYVVVALATLFAIMARRASR
jgi:autotransporter-associated beta strand protein